MSPLAILSRLDTLNVDRTLDDFEVGAGAYLPDGEHLAFMLGETAKRVGSAPSLAELHAALGFSPVCLAVERWLLAWEIDQGASSVTLTGDLDYPGWYTPDNVSIVLMPSPEPGASYAYVGGFEWELAARSRCCGRTRRAASTGWTPATTPVTSSVDPTGSCTTSRDLTCPSPAT